MKLKTSDLKNFFALASPVINKSILKIHDYIALTKDGYLQKKNDRMSISHKIDVQVEEPVLIEENEIASLVKLTKSSEIDLKVKGNKVLLSDGVVNASCQTVPYKDWERLMPDGEKQNECVFTYEILEAIGLSNNCVSKIGGGTNSDFVHLKDGYIYGTDRAKLYTKRIDGIPDVSFDSECANVISKFQEMDFHQIGTWNIFSTSTTTYCFQQYGDVKPLDISMILALAKIEGDFFEFNASDFLYFNDLVVSTGSKGVGISICVMKGNKITNNQPEVDKNKEIEIPYEGKFLPDIWYNPKIVAPFVRSLGKSKLRFYPCQQHHVFVTDPEESNFLGMIGGLVKENQVIYQTKK